MAIGKDKRRLTITLPCSVYSALHATSEAAGASVASLCSMLLSESIPALQQMRDALIAARTDQAQAYDQLSSMLSGAQVLAGQGILEIEAEQLKLRRKKGDANAAT